MSDKTRTGITPPSESALDLPNLEVALLKMIEQKGLPTSSVFVPIKERGVVFNNIDAVIEKLRPEKKPESVYISKFIAAVSAGLFDAALNYLWDETINELRHRVAQYDLAYFYDI